MIITDTLSNFFSKLKNGYLSNKYKITQPKTKQVIYILNLLTREGLIKGFKIPNNDAKRVFIYLKYQPNQVIIKKIKRISKPGKRVYIKNKDLFKKEQGIYLISSSKGIITDIEAKKQNLGGELICQII